MSSSYSTLSYHIISYLMFFDFISSADLLSIPFHSILLNFKSIWFYSLLLNLIYYIVQYSISHQWMICVYLSVHPSVYPSVCLSVCLSICPFVCLFVCLSVCMKKVLFPFLFFSLFSFLMKCTYTDTHTHTHMNICFFLWLVHITSKVSKWRIVFEWSYYLIFDIIR